MNKIDKLREIETEIANLKERVTEISNPENDIKFVVSGIIASLEEARKGVEFFIKALENLDSIQHRNVHKLVITEET